MVSYAALPPEIAQRNAAELRARRLNKAKNNWILGMTMDLFIGAGPWVVGVSAVAAGLVAMYENVDGAAETFALFNAPVAIAAIASFSAFLLVGKQATNLGNNAAIIGQYGNLSGSLVNIALFLKSQISSGKSVEFLTLQDGRGGTFQTTRVGLVCASVCYIVKYTYRGVEIRPEGLPLGQDPRLLRAYITLVTPSAGGPGMSAFSACILLMGEAIDEITTGEKPSEYAVLFAQINAVTAAEGAIGGTAGYSTPFLMKYLLYALQIAYLLLFLVTDLVPSNRWNAVWIAAIFTFTTTVRKRPPTRTAKTTPHTDTDTKARISSDTQGFWAISERYGNPNKLRSKAMGQKTFVASACIDTEASSTTVEHRKFAGTNHPIDGY
ncbi:hypothetical protein N9S81_00490 [bacterium]|nr:hypothetical protein [bacterium]